MGNRRPQRGNSTSQFKGVYWDKARTKWVAAISKTIDGSTKTRHIGRFDDEESAARAYDAAAIEQWGEFARLNFEREEAA